MRAFHKFPQDLFIVLAWIVITLIFIITPVLENTFVRTILGIPMVLFIPGYMLVAALFPKKNELEAIERTALSFGLSIAIVPLLGLMLNFTSGIRLTSILFTLCLYSIILAFFTAYRRKKLPEDEQFSVSFYRIYELIGSEINTSKSRIDKILTIILIFSIAFAIGMVYFVITTPKTGEKFTEFYILGPSGKADNYQTNLNYNSSTEILVGVVNHEYTSVNYTVQVALDKNVLSNTGLRLNNNETWENNLTFIPDKEGNNMKLEFWLFKDDNFTAPYRALHLWVNVT